MKISPKCSAIEHETISNFFSVAPYVLINRAGWYDMAPASIYCVTTDLTFTDHDYTTHINACVAKQTTTQKEFVIKAHERLIKKPNGFTITAND